METITRADGSQNLKMKSSIVGVRFFDAKVNSDERGVFTNVLNQQIIKENTSEDFFQISYSHNVLAGTLRGFHFQREPSSEFKFIHCLSGELFDVLVDVRSSSQTFGLTNVFRLSGGSEKILLVPPGVAHGYQTIENHTTLLYVITGRYKESLQERFNPLSPEFREIWPLPVSSISWLDKHSEIWPREF